MTAIMLLAPAWASFAQDTTTAKTSVGQTYMQTSSGKALYVFDGDRSISGGPASSTCYDQCAQTWPPFKAGADAKPHSDGTIKTRKDGAKQWAYKDRPLYTFVRDTASGMTDGEGFNGNTWHLAEPGASDSRRMCPRRALLEIVRAPPRHRLSAAIRSVNLPPSA